MTKTYDSYREFLEETGELSRVADCVISRKKNKVAEHLINAFDATGSEASYEAVREVVSSHGYRELHNLYQGLEMAMTEVIQSLQWLIDTDTLYLERIFAGLFLNEPVEVSKEGKATIITAIGQS
ncbi:conserved hypothetical protein [Vibrio crassostreae]|nr:conserved hypothetical protein [Vibrio crassostreae]